MRFVRLARMKLIFWIALLPVAAFAQINQFELHETSKPTGKPWVFSGSVGFNFAWIATQDFVGVASNNPSATPAAHLNLELRYREFQHEWRNNLGIDLGYTYAPPPSEWIKTADSLRLNSFYLYHFRPMFGAFGALNMKTSMLPGEDVESGQNTYVITDALSGVELSRVTSDRLKLTNPFTPLFLEQWAGLFLQAADKPELFFELRAGAVGRENFAAGQRVITCNGPCNVNILVQQLANVYEAGPGSGLLFKSEFFEKKLTYRLDFDVIWAWLQTPEIRPIGSLSRISFDLNSTLSLKLMSWLSLNWNLRLLQNPAIIEKIQFLSNLTLAANFGI